MRMTFSIDTGEGRRLVEVGPMAITEWELEHRTKISRLSVDGIGVSDMTELVWRQLKLDGDQPGTLDSWRRSLRDIDPEATGDPT